MLPAWLIGFECISIPHAIRGIEHPFFAQWNSNSASALRYPGVEGTYYFIAGIGVNYQRTGRISLAPMRTGVGLRAGVNAGYLSYTRERDILPF